MARSRDSFKGEVMSVSYRTIREIVNEVSNRYPAEAAIAVLSSMYGWTQDFLM